MKTPPNGEETPARWDAESEPTRIGAYHILTKIGEGGFGDVYVAEQESPIRRRVALKLLKRGMDTRAVLARFQAERQALAMMDHPYIAHILDAGETESGRPYFVMEWIRGEPITRYAAGEKLDVRRRVSLMAAAADAVAHAHGRGVLHRDIKPSNVLVSTRDGEPWPSIIDFGIAKALGAPLSDQTLVTMQGQLLGTPAYMSPEQAAGATVGPQADVFSLGAVLYELLAGAPPASDEALRSGGIDQIPRMIRESEPVPPSTRAPAELRGACRGELDWIALFALDHDPERRYPDAAAFAADLRRYLRGEAVEAPAPSPAYRSRRYLKRRVRRLREGIGDLAVRAGVSVKLALQARQIAEERDRARRERENAEHVATFLSKTLGSLEPAALGEALWADFRARISDAERRANRPPEETSAMLARLDAVVADANPTNVARRLLDEEILARAGRAIEDLDDDPEIAARLRATLGSTYIELGMLDKAVPYLERALAERRRVLGTDHPESIGTLSSLVLLLQRQGKLDEAETLGREALDRARRALGEEHRATLEALTNLGVLLAHQGKMEEAESVRRQAMDAHRRALGTRDIQTITAIGNVGSFLNTVGKHAEAEGFLRESLALSRKWLGEAHAATLSTANNLAMMLEHTGRSDEAEPLMREALVLSRRVRGDDHTETLIAQNNLATILEHQGKLEECAAVMEEAFEGLRHAVGETHLYTLGVRMNLGATLVKLDRLEAAESHLRAAYETCRTVHGADHQYALNAALQLGDALTRQGYLEEAAEILTDAIARASRVLPDSDWLLAVLRVKRARVHELRGEHAEARGELELAHEQFVASLGSGHERTQEALATLIDVCETTGDVEAARRLREA